MSEPTNEPLTLEKRAYAQIRDALVTLQWASDGFHEDEAQIAMDALDWLEENTRDVGGCT